MAQIETVVRGHCRKCGHIWALTGLERTSERDEDMAEEVECPACGGESASSWKIGPNTKPRDTGRIPPLFICFMCHPGTISYAGKVVDVRCPECKRAYQNALERV